MADFKDLYVCRAAGLVLNKLYAQRTITLLALILSMEHIFIKCLGVGKSHEN